MTRAVTRAFRSLRNRKTKIHPSADDFPVPEYIFVPRGSKNGRGDAISTRQGMLTKVCSFFQQNTNATKPSHPSAGDPPIPQYIFVRKNDAEAIFVHERIEV